MDPVNRSEGRVVKALPRTVLVLSIAILVGACANSPQRQSASHKKLKLETLDHGPMRPKPYLYREVDDPKTN